MTERRRVAPLAPHPLTAPAAPLNPWVQVLLVGAGYYAGSLAGFALRFPSSGISLLWPPTAVLTAALLVTPPHRWPALLGGALAAHAVAHAQDGIGTATWLVQFLANAVQALLAGVLIRRYAGAGPLLRDFRSAAVFVASAAAIAPIVASLIAAFVYVRMEWAPDFVAAWRARTASNAVAALTLLPTFLIIGLHDWSTWPSVSRRRLQEIALWLACTLSAFLVVIYWQPETGSAYPLRLFTPVPFLLWAALRFGAGGLSAAILFTVPFELVEAYRVDSAPGAVTEDLVSIQMFVAFTAAPLMLMAGLLEENRTEHHRLVQAEQQNAAILRAIPDMMFVLSKSGTYLAFFAKRESELLVPPSAFLGRHMRDVLPSGVADMFEDAFARSSTDEVSVVEYSLVMDGELRHYEARFVGFDSDRILSMARDITDRVRARDALSESQRRYALATAAAGVGVWDLKLPTGELVFEPPLLAVLGYEDAATPEGRVRAIAASRVHELHARLAAQAAAAAPADVEHSVIHRDGSTRWFLTRGEVVERLEGGRARMMGTYTDVTERRLAEEALAQAEARLSFLARTSTLAEVTASIAHELNQPLCAIVANAGACARLLDSAASHDEIRSALKDVIDDSLRASDVLTRTRMLFTQHDVQAAPLDLAEAVHDVLKLAQPQLRQAGVEVEVEARPGTPLMALADALHVRQVLLNLVLNGVDSMREVDGRRRRLDIQLRRGRHMAYVTVRDRGKGLDPATRPQIFEPFFTTKPQGLGMGLTISRTIVDSYGGSIWAVANADGGATFRFSLPVAEAASTV